MRPQSQTRIPLTWTPRPGPTHFLPSPVAKGEVVVKKSLLVVSLLAVAVVLGTALLAPGPKDAATAAESPAAVAKPAVVVSLAGYTALMNDVNYAGKLADNPDLAVGLEVMLKLVTQNRGLDGIDKEKPWGIVLAIDETKLASGARRGDVLSGYAFVPVSDFGRVRETMELFTGPAKDAGSGVLEFKAANRPLYVKHAGNWALVSSRAELLANVPADPARLLEGLSDQYDLAIRLHPANVPEPLRRQALGQLKKRAEAELRRKPGESEEEHAGRKLLTEHAMGAIAQAFEELEQFTVGVKLDTKSGKALLELTLAARSGTKLAEQMAGLGSATSELAGLALPGAAINAHCAWRCSPAGASRLVEIVTALRNRAIDDIERKEPNAEKAKVAKDLVGGLADVAQKTIQSGRIDKALSVVLDPAGLRLVTGAYIADGAKLDTTFRAALDAVRRDNPGVIEQLVKTDVQKVGEVSLHTLTLPVPYEAANRDKLVKMIGENIEVVLGIGPTRVFLALGKEPLSTLKEAIGRAEAEGSKKVMPAEVSIAASPAARCVAELSAGSKRPQAERIAKALGDASGRDHLRWNVTPIDRGLRCRLEVEDGVLRAFAVMGQGGKGGLTPLRPAKPSQPAKKEAKKKRQA